MSTQLSNGQSKSNSKANFGASFPKLNEKAIRAAQDEKADMGLSQKFPLHRKKIISLLNLALANELVNMLRYRHQHNLCVAMAEPELSRDFLKYANQELSHADKIAKRIFELNGVADFSPHALVKQKQTKHKIPKNTVSMLKKNLANGRAMIETYRQMIARVSNYDTETCEILEAILAVEEKNMAEQNRYLVKQTQSLVAHPVQT